MHGHTYCRGIQLVVNLIVWLYWKGWLYSLSLWMPTVPHAIITWTVTWCSQHHAHRTPRAHSHYALQQGVYPLIHTYRIIRRNSKNHPFLMCPGWSFQSPLLGTIYGTSLDNYIQWISAIYFLSNRSSPQLIWIKQCLILPYRNAVQEAQTFLKMANICCIVDMVSVNEGLAAEQLETGN